MHIETNRKQFLTMTKRNRKQNGYKQPDSETKQKQNAAWNPKRKRIENHERQTLNQNVDFNARRADRGTKRDLKRNRNKKTKCRQN